MKIYTSVRVRTYDKTKQFSSVVFFLFFKGRTRDCEMEIDCVAKFFNIFLVSCHKKFTGVVFVPK